ncbi:MAG: anion permease [Halobacteriaceae archaeon]
MELLLGVGLLVAVFVGFNIGGSSTGVAFGPAVGSGVLSKVLAAALMTAFALLGGWTVGRNVIETMGGRIVPSSEFTLVASVVVLFFVGLALLISNLFGVPASTSMTAVGAIAGLGTATGTIDWAVMGQIVIWWLVAPILAFWVCAVVGRYLYPHLLRWSGLDSSGVALVVVDRSGRLPRPQVAPDATPRDVVAGVLVVVIGCYMAFSAGASNVANAVAPLVGGGFISPDHGVLLAAGAIGAGAFTIARRTLDTVGNDLTDLPLLAALVVEVVSASLITFLSLLGIPASLAVSATMCIVGLGWGRATRAVSFSEAASAAVHGPDEETAGLAGSRTGGAGGEDADGERGANGSAGGGGTGGTGADEEVPPIGQGGDGELAPGDLFDPSTTGRVIVLWLLTPSLSALASFVVFWALPV